MYLDRDIDADHAPHPRSGRSPRTRMRADTRSPFGFVLGADGRSLLPGRGRERPRGPAPLAGLVFYVVVTGWAQAKDVAEHRDRRGGGRGARARRVGGGDGELGVAGGRLFGIMFVWTPPHFSALAMRISGDYAEAGVPMLPVVRGEAETRRQILLYSLVLFATTLLLVPVGAHGPGLHGGRGRASAAWFVYQALQVWRGADDARTRRLFSFSILYLAGLFGAVGADAVL